MVEEKMVVRLTFLQDCLGTLPTDDDIYTKFIATKRKDAENPKIPNPLTAEELSEELANLPKNEEDEDYYRGITVFPRLRIEGTDEQIVGIYGHMLKGFFKNAAWACNQVPDSLTSKCFAYIKKIDNLVHVNRISPVNLTEEAKEYMKDHANTLPLCQRPLRASTAKGEMIALSCSEFIPEGSTVEFEITCLNKETMNLVIELLDYGKYNGLGCWRNSGKGQFDWIDADLGKKRPIDPKYIPKKGKKKAAEE